MAVPLSIEQLLEHRETKLDEWQQVHAPTQTVDVGLSDGLHTNTIDLGPRPKVLTVVAWNVQTFEAGKSLGNPFVNKVVNRVLGELDADVCILLETRADSYVNLNAIETGHVGTKGWKQDSVPDEEDEVDEDDVDPPEDQELDRIDDFLGRTGDEDDDALDLDLLNGGDPLTYLQTVSEMTGKLWRPPTTVYVYDAAFVKLNRMIADIDRIRSLRRKGKKKLTKKETSQLTKLRKRRDRYRKGERDYRTASDADEDKVRFAKRYNYPPKLLRGICMSGSSPSVDWKQVLTAEEFHVFRQYYQLQILHESSRKYARRDPVDVDVVDAQKLSAEHNWRFVFELRRCPSCGERLGKGQCGVCETYGPGTTTLGNLRGCIDRITFYRCTIQESYSVLVRPSATVCGPSTRGVWLTDKQAVVHTLAANLLMRAPSSGVDSNGVVIAGDTLGFSDGKVGFYGRCPYRIPLEFWPPGASSSLAVPLVAFHGPFGKSTLAGIELRTAAMRELLSGDSGLRNDSGALALRDAPRAIVMGDFNLDWAPDAPKPSSAERLANNLYDGFAKLDLLPAIGGGVATSLSSIYGSASKWKKATSISELTSSAYDNCFVRDDQLRGLLANAAVIDVVQWIVDNLDEFELPKDDPRRGKTDELSELQLAFYIYRRYVSDHLPIVVEFMCEPLAPESALLRRIEAQRQAISKSKVLLPPIELDVTCESIVELELVDGPTPHAYAITSGSTQQDWYADWIGRVAAHQDDHLIVVCELPRDSTTVDTARLAVQPPGGTTLIAKLLELFPVGSTVHCKTYRHRWTKQN